MDLDRRWLHQRLPRPRRPQATGGQNGPETARTEDTDGDGFADECYQSAYEEANEEFHIRLNNLDDPGSQYVEFCLDRDGDGCDDVNKRVRDSISIKWLDN